MVIIVGLLFIFFYVNSLKNISYVRMTFRFSFMKITIQLSFYLGFIIHNRLYPITRRGHDNNNNNNDLLRRCWRHSRLPVLEDPYALAESACIQ